MSMNKFLLGLVVLLSVKALTGCTNDEPTAYHKYRLASGQVIECRDNPAWSFSNCGQYFTKCKDGLTYHCQVNVVPLN